MDSWLLLKQKQRDELRNRHREQFLLLRSKIKGLESEARIASGGILSLRERQQSLLTSKKYGEAYQQLKMIKRAEKDELLSHRKAQRSASEKNVKNLLEQHVKEEEELTEWFESQLKFLQQKKTCTRRDRLVLSHERASNHELKAKDKQKSNFKDAPNGQEVAAGESRAYLMRDETTATKLTEYSSGKPKLQPRVTLDGGCTTLDVKKDLCSSLSPSVFLRATSRPHVIASERYSPENTVAFRRKHHDLYCADYSGAPWHGPLREPCAHDELHQAHGPPELFMACAVNDPNKSKQVRSYVRESMTSTLSGCASNREFFSNNRVGLQKIPGCWQNPCTYSRSSSENICLDRDRAIIGDSKLEHAAEALLTAACALLENRVDSTIVNECTLKKPTFGNPSLKDDTFEIDQEEKKNSPDPENHATTSHVVSSESDPFLQTPDSKIVALRNEGLPSNFIDDDSGDEAPEQQSFCLVSTHTVPRLTLKGMQLTEKNHGFRSGVNPDLVEQTRRGLVHLNGEQHYSSRLTLDSERKNAKELKSSFSVDFRTPPGQNIRTSAARRLIEKTNPPESTGHLKYQAEPGGDSSRPCRTGNQKSHHVAQNETNSQTNSHTHSLKMQAVNNHNSSGSTRIRAIEQQSTAVPHTDRRFTTEDFRNLFSYARHGKYKQVIELLKDGCPAEGRDQFGNSPFIVACQNGNARIVKALIRHGAQINSQNKQGCSGLHYCIAYGFNALSDYLISKGADDKILNKLGLSPYEGIK